MVENVGRDARADHAEHRQRPERDSPWGLGGCRRDGGRARHRPGERGEHPGGQNKGNTREQHRSDMREPFADDRVGGGIAQRHGQCQGELVERHRALQSVQHEHGEATERAEHSQALAPRGTRPEQRQRKGDRQQWHEADHQRHESAALPIDDPGLDVVRPRTTGGDHNAHRGPVGTAERPLAVARQPNHGKDRGPADHAAESHFSRRKHDRRFLHQQKADAPHQADKGEL